MLTTMYMLQVSGGKLKLLHTMPLDEVYGYNKKFYKW